MVMLIVPRFLLFVNFILSTTILKNKFNIPLTMVIKFTLYENKIIGS